MKAPGFKWLFPPVILLLASCAGTPENFETDPSAPIRFLYTGSAEAAHDAIAGILTRCGFAIRTDDRDAGIILSQNKLLADDEKNNVEDTARVLNIRLVQYGKVLFIVRKAAPNRIEAEMTCYLVLEKTDLDTMRVKIEELKLLRNHPLCAKLVRLLNTAGFDD
jgi:hypothetical protein